MRSLRSAALLAVAILVAGTAFAQTRGPGRIEGTIVDAQGLPLADVVVRAQKVGTPEETAEATSDAKGAFALQRLTLGEWRVEFHREGLAAEPITVEVFKGKAPILDVKMLPPPEDPMVAINAELQRAAKLMQGGDIPAARAVYEALYEEYPQPFQFPFAIATTYLAEKNYDRALEYVKIAAEKDPTAVDVKMLTAEIHQESGNREEARRILEGIDLKEVQDPVLFINAGIILINDGQPDEAVKLFDRLIDRFPEDHQIYYYRGRAHLVATNLAEAKADLEKFVSMAPADAKEVADAKKIIEELSKK